MLSVGLLGLDSQQTVRVHGQKTLLVIWAPPGGSVVTPPAVQETWVWSLGGEDLVGK